jgi:hypothetical protein
MNFFQYKTTTERMAPNWITISNNFVKGLLAVSKNADAMAIWPVEDTGRNSVIPSMMARMMACI